MDAAHENGFEAMKRNGSVNNSSSRTTTAVTRITTERRDCTSAFR
jgi:hypothetical protein